MLIGLNGRKQAGKDTVYERIAHKMRDVMPVERVSFADMLYHSAAEALAISVADLREWKNDPRRFVAVGLNVGGSFIPTTSQTIREFLQGYGTEAHRNIFGDDFWVEQVGPRLAGHRGRIICVTDVRFPNEAEAVRAAGGDVVTIIGPYEVEHAADEHASEAPLPDDLIDVWLTNDRRDDNFRSLDRRLDTLLRLHLGGGAS